MSVHSLTSCQNALVICQHRVSSLLTTTGNIPVKTWIVSSCWVPVRTVTGLLHQARASVRLGSYEGCSFIWSSLRLGREGTERSGIHFRKVLPGWKTLGCRRWRKMKGGETDKMSAITLTSLVIQPAAALPFSPHPLARPAPTSPSPPLIPEQCPSWYPPGL